MVGERGASRRQGESVAVVAPLSPVGHAAGENQRGATKKSPFVGETAGVHGRGAANPWRALFGYSIESKELPGTAEGGYLRGSPMHFFSQGIFNEGPWDAFNVFTTDYRITLRDAFDPSPAPDEENSYWNQWEQECAMSTIVSCALPNAMQDSDDRTIQTLLDIHAAVYGHPHPNVHQLSRELRGVHSEEHREYMATIGKELERAVRQGILRVEVLEPPPWPFPDAIDDKPPSGPGPIGPTEESFFVRVLDETKFPMGGAVVRVRGAGIAPIDRTADAGGWVEVTCDSVPDSCVVRWRAADEKAFWFEQTVSLRLADDEDSADKRLEHLGYGAPSREDSVRQYQNEFDHADTGELADIRDALTAWHNGGRLPKSGTEQTRVATGPVLSDGSADSLGLDGRELA